jgi:hypothetical protein
MPYDHLALAFVGKTIPLKSYVPPSSTWSTTPDDFVNRQAMKESTLSEYFTHILGIENKIAYSNLMRGENKQVKPEKKKK